MPTDPTSLPYELDRRRFLHLSGLLAAGAFLPLRGADGTVVLPFANGERELVRYPQKRPLLRLTARPPQLETPFAVFNDGLITPNDAFFVRYHLSGIPTKIDPSEFRLRVRGQVKQPLELTLTELKKIAEPVNVIAVNQCSGNSRGFFSPRVNGGQLGNGAMGNARWTGIPLRALLNKAGVEAGARQVSFQGLDRAPLPATPEFVKALDLDHALSEEVLVAYAMNGADLPMLNGYPLRLVVPGYYGTYWVKHLNDIQVLGNVFAGFWMSAAYRVPDNPEHAVNPGETPKTTVPISRFNVRSFITSLQSGDHIPKDTETKVRGIAFDSGSGIQRVEFSSDGGMNWRTADLGQDLGRYSFREWKSSFKPAQAGACELKVRATSTAGETQPAEPRWNPAGYMRNVVETVRVNVLALIVALLLVATHGLHAEEIQLPPEPVILARSELPGYSLVNGHCLTCHSTDYIRYQPPTSSRTYWRATVTKMQKVFGAPLPDDVVEPVVDYLTKIYGAEKNAPAPQAMEPAAAPPATRLPEKH